MTVSGKNSRERGKPSRYRAQVLRTPTGKRPKFLRFDVSWSTLQPVGRRITQVRFGRMCYSADSAAVFLARLQVKCARQGVLRASGALIGMALKGSTNVPAVLGPFTEQKGKIGTFIRSRPQRVKGSIRSRPRRADPLGALQHRAAGTTRREPRRCSARHVKSRAWSAAGDAAAGQRPCAARGVSRHRRRHPGGTYHHPGRRVAGR